MPDYDTVNFQVLIRIKAAGVNPVEAYIRSGIHVIKPQLPYIPGTDAAGLVEKVGANVKDHQVVVFSFFVSSYLFETWVRG